MTDTTLEDKLNALAAESEERPLHERELARVLGLPYQLPITPEELEAFNMMELRADREDKDFRVNDKQAECLLAWDEVGGLFASMAVGKGKTLVCQMIAHRCFKAGLRKVMMVLPGAGVQQLIRRDYPWARQRVELGYPYHDMEGMSPSARKALVDRNLWGLYIVPYSLLSRSDTAYILDKIAPEAVIADEAHYLKHRSTPRTARLMECMSKFKSRFACLSGTITNKSIKDYVHLILWALKDKSPLPVYSSIADEWALVLDSRKEGSPAQDDVEKLRKMVLWANDKCGPGGVIVPDDRAQEFLEPDEVSGVRRAFKLRRHYAPGVVSMGRYDVGPTLWIENNPVPDFESQPGYSEVKRLSDQVFAEWKTPNGEEIEHAIHTYKWLDELTAGFYNLLSWPTPEAYAERKGIPLDQAASVVARTVEWFHERQAYLRVLRDFLSNREFPQWDTPLLVGAELNLHGPINVGPRLYEAWKKAKDLEFPEMIQERDSTFVPLSDYKIRHAINWTREELRTRPKRGVLVWYFHNEIGKWARDLFRKEWGDRVSYCPAGKASDNRLLEDDIGTKIVLASISAHGFAKNLQPFDRQFFIQWPRAAFMAEQTLGRTHRQGQESDDVVGVTCNTTDFDHEKFFACLSDAMYVHETDNRQKVIYASYVPAPKYYPQSWLRERGFEPEILTKRQEKALMELASVV